MRVVTFKIKEDLLHKLDVYAIKSGMSRSELIRQLIKSFVDQKHQSYSLKFVRLE